MIFTKKSGTDYGSLSKERGQEKVPGLTSMKWHY